MFGRNNRTIVIFSRHVAIIFGSLGLIVLDLSL